jgi:hypothetical protein
VVEGEVSFDKKLAEVIDHDRQPGDHYWDRALPATCRRMHHCIFRFRLQIS